MSRIKRYITALRRYNRSCGFGIHSPFAFYFVRRVLREKCPYYAYEALYQCRRTAASIVRSRQLKKGILSYKSAKMLFRITCYFKPATILQIGTSYGVSAMSMLCADSRSTMVLYRGANTCCDIFDRLTAECSHRIENTLTLADAAQRYAERLGDGAAFILINSIDSDADARIALATATDAIKSGGVVIMRNLNNSEAMKKMWRDCCSVATHGMSFSNYRMGVFVGYKHLPRQNYTLWF